MKISVRYLILAVLVLGIFTALVFSLSAPLIYSREQDSFISHYHDNTDVLKLQQLNSTTDLLPLMQDLMDFTGPIVLNINLRDMDQVRRDIALFKTYNKNLDNLIVKLDMKESEINDFSKSKTKQRELLDELLNASVSLDELKNLEIQYRDQNNPNMLVSLTLQQEAIRKKIKDIYGQYQNETKKVEEIGQKFGANTIKEEESLQEFQQIVKENDKTVPIIDTSSTRIPTMSLIIKPDAGKYLDAIDISAFYSSTGIQKNNYPITIFIDNDPVRQASTDNEGVFHDTFVIEKITAGIHQINATSGSTVSEPRTLNVTAVSSFTSIILKPVSNKPEVQVSGTVVANKPVRSASVNIVVDSRTSIQLTTDKNGLYKTQMRFSPGTHWIDARFDNASYPIFSSISSAYEIVASQDKILSIKVINATRNADTLRLNLIPDTGKYKDNIYISGKLSGKDPKYRNVDVFIDDAYHRTLQTGSDGSYAESYVIEKIRNGNHTVFTSYIEPGVGVIYSEFRQFTVYPVDSITLLEIEMTDSGTGLICQGNITANGHGVSNAPLELVWDEPNIINIQSNANGSFRQQVTLPVGNHSIYAKFTSRDYPVNPSKSSTYPVTIKPPIDLYVTPQSVYYLDALDIWGSLHMQVAANRDVRIILDDQNLTTLMTDLRGNFSARYTVEQMTAGNHTMQALSGDFTSEMRKFQILSVNSNISLFASPIPASSRVTCSGNLFTDTISVRSAPVLLIWDDQNVVETVTNRYGHFEEILTLPPGKHKIQAIFNQTSQFPINPSSSAVVEVDIPRIIFPGNLTIHITPDQLIFGDILSISGKLSAEKNDGEGVQIYIDGKKLDAGITDRGGNYTLKYPIDRITAGVHFVNAVSGNFRTGTVSILVFPVNSQTTLTAIQTPGTARVVCYGNIRAQNRSVSFAPVTLSWDNGAMIKTNTDKYGNFSEGIILPAGTHRIQAQFNNSDIFPLYSSKSIPVELNISLGLSLDVRPASGIYKDTLTFEGTLVRPDNLEGAVDLFLDNNFLATTKTDRTGRYIHKMVIEQMLDGKHTVQARSADLSSGVRTFTVIPVQSLTTLTVTRVNNSALFECYGMVMAFDRPGDVILRPLSIRDVLDIIVTFGRVPLASAKRPVSDAEIALMVNNVTLLEVQTDTSGRFSRVVALPAGDNVVAARFVNNRFPIVPSQSKEIAVNIPSANLSPLENIRSSPSGMLVPVIVVAVILLVFTGGSFFYLKRRSILFRTRRTPAAINLDSETLASAEMLLKEIEAADPFLSTVLPPDPDMGSTDPILTRYIRILNAQGLSTAARTVYVHFTGTIAQRLHIRSHRTLTPREFLRSCDRRPFAGTFSSFVTIYEQVRYGGAKSPDKEGEFKEATKKTDESIGGEED